MARFTNRRRGKARTSIYPRPGGQFTSKVSSYKYRDPYCEDKIIFWPSSHWNFYTENRTSLCSNGPLYMCCYCTAIDQKPWVRKKLSFIMTSSNENLFSCYWPFVRVIHQWRGALMFSLICTWTNAWANKSRRRWFETPSHYDVTVMNDVGQIVW